MLPEVDTGSFRDPKGRVYLLDDRVFRTVMPPGVDDYEFVRSAGLFEKLVDDRLLVGLTEVETDVLAGQVPGVRYVLEHPKLPYISYPYEWSYSALKAAAILQLDVLLIALDHDVTLADATAYNVQFHGPRPIFIDHLAFRRYREGEYWLGHRQFCEQFLNPLLLRAKLGIPHNAWYRGNLEGISAQELSALLPIRKKMSPRVFTHVVLQASFQKASMKKEVRAVVPSTGAFPKTAFQKMLCGLRRWIVSLDTPNAEKSVWGDYAQDNTYESDEARRKRSFVTRFVSAVQPDILWDIGCNTGDYAKVALESGTKYAVGFDFDQLALDTAFSRAEKEDLNFLPLFLDVANPTPNQGWAESERKGLASRATGDAVLALALVHHLAITKNVPLGEIVRWLVSFAPTGVVEFVPKADPMVQELVRLRKDIFDDYEEEVFLDHLKRLCEIVEIKRVSATGRQLIWYRRRHHNGSS